MRSAIGVAVGRAVQWLLRVRGGKGSGAPGLVTNRIAPALLPRVLASFPQGLVVVSGTAGKSTTTKMVAGLLRAHGMRVFTNSSTANLPQGITSAVLDQGDWRGRVDADIAVLEMDEAFGALMSSTFEARVVTLTNINLDDIARFESSDRVTRLLTAIALRARSAVVLNADDASLEIVAASLTEAAPGVSIRRFGVSADVMATHPQGLGSVRTAKERLGEGLGTRVETVSGRDAVIDIGGSRQEVTLPARGVHFAVDAAAAFETARAVMGDAFDASLAASTLSTLDPVFGRGETVEIAGQQIECVLVQNTASFQLNIDALRPGLERVFVGIGDEEEDTSWLWTVRTHALGRVDIVAGPKADAMANRLAYDGVPFDAVDVDLIRGFEAFLALPAPSTGVKTVVFTSRSMRKIRGHYGLTSEEVKKAGIR
ncbi:putative UDP-N-acetylmuramyl tripeptide synthase [Microbacterium sp. C448]|uniref:MurT ligase domain-containing protein n=1 Tax=Microbacterium sp. C448 TaxID=1177594 RepID=UPI0003DE3E36|nr:MurT ligase domain-containing protein [Microbacterium sp. C448]CDK00742.1 putative UDP-N-acetylmuramyl tripeptide synthase [Microbacterium sp. C448]